mmetsp:Transcript_38317/g.89115  ORF Transcript_38317/g.89115 Transcript_38317/m.89115 type:complete len:202 (+) Transcript_38317:309-914(+)
MLKGRQNRNRNRIRNICIHCDLDEVSPTNDTHTCHPSINILNPARSLIDPFLRNYQTRTCARTRIRVQNQVHQRQPRTTQYPRTHRPEVRLRIGHKYHHCQYHHGDHRHRRIPNPQIRMYASSGTVDGSSSENVKGDPEQGIHDADSKQLVQQTEDDGVSYGPSTAVPSRLIDGRQCDWKRDQNDASPDDHSLGMGLVQFV